MLADLAHRHPQNHDSLFAEPTSAQESWVPLRGCARRNRSPRTRSARERHTRDSRADATLAIVAPTPRQRNSIPARGIVCCNPELAALRRLHAYVRYLARPTMASPAARGRGVKAFQRDSDDGRVDNAANGLRLEHGREVNFHFVAEAQLVRSVIRKTTAKSFSVRTVQELVSRVVRLTTAFTERLASFCLPSGPRFRGQVARPATAVRARIARADATLAMVAPTAGNATRSPRAGLVCCNPELGALPSYRTCRSRRSHSARPRSGARHRTRFPHRHRAVRCTCRATAKCVSDQIPSQLHDWTRPLQARRLSFREGFQPPVHMHPSRNASLDH